MRDRGYDTAQICLNGHVINSSTKSSTQHNQKFCDKCGDSTITTCQNCDTEIRGYYHGNYAPFHPPGFCHNCGKPFPWTEKRLHAAQELADGLNELTEEDKEILKKSLDDIVRDTPNSTIAATRFKKLVSKAGQEAAKGFKDLLVDIASETAKKIIWPD